ncbi:MAG: hypothetical protein ACKOAG_08350, partial [Candidatus Kapaibacterium sp.]
MDSRLVPGLDPSQSFFTSYDKDGKRISFYGDNHPYYAGSVVKAMASAKNGFPKVADLFHDVIEGTQRELTEDDRESQRQRLEALDSFHQELDSLFAPT